MNHDLEKELTAFTRVTAGEGPLVGPCVAERFVGMTRSSIADRARQGGLGHWRFFGHSWYALRELRQLRAELRAR